MACVIASHYNAPDCDFSCFPSSIQYKEKSIYCCDDKQSADAMHHSLGGCVAMGPYWNPLLCGLEMPWRIAICHNEDCGGGGGGLPPRD